MLRAMRIRFWRLGLLLPVMGVFVLGCGESQPGSRARLGSADVESSRTGPAPEVDDMAPAEKFRYAAQRNTAQTRPARDGTAPVAATEAPSSSALGVAANASPPADAPIPATPAPAFELREAEESRDAALATADQGRGPGQGGDKFAHTVDNDFLSVLDAPFSTFSIDVDTASYSKTRMYLQQYQQLPPADAVRIEELINYFDYTYAGPTNSEDPFALHVEVADAPWNAQHLLARIALKGREIERDRPARNLVFLIDVSGSMDQHNKLPLVKAGLQMLTTQLDENDRVAIVVYAGAAGLVLPPTYGDNRNVILEAVERLQAGGSTNGGEGIRLAYNIAREQFVAGGVNRVLLCTDGDFNVGTTSTGDLVRLAEEQARTNVYLSVLGFGMGNHNDAMLEELSNKANGNYAFIDGEGEARKVLLDQIDSTLVTIAKDVKLQIEFNPAVVASYRLIGYENRRLRDEDFNDDKKDAGEIGAGHAVTALYELVPAGIEETNAKPPVNDLRYQKRRELSELAAGDELLTVNLRFKQPEGATSELRQAPVPYQQRRFTEATSDFQFAAAVAAFGMLLRESPYRGDANYDAVLEIASSSLGEDRYGYRGEFLELVDAARRLARPAASSTSFAPIPLRHPVVVRTVRSNPATRVVYVSSPPHAEFDLSLLALVVVAFWIVAAVVCLTVAWLVIRGMRWGIEPQVNDGVLKPVR